MRARTILLVDDDAKFRSNVQKTLGRVYAVTHAASETEFRREFRPCAFDLIILDMRLETGREGLQLLREILAFDELQPVIMVSAYGDTDAVLDSAESGALMFLHKQEFTPELLARMVEAVLQQARIRRHLAALQSRVSNLEPFALEGKNPSVRRALELVQKAADDPDSTILVTGERGTGHGSVAQVIHDRSRRRAAAPFIAASGLSMRSQDSQQVLFGSPRREGGPRQKGLLEQANGGMLFVNQLETLDAGIRTALGDALRKRTLELSPGAPSIPLDLQFVAGAGAAGSEGVSESLRESAAGGQLVEIYLPPVRDRREDIPILTALVLQDLRREGRTTARTMSRNALAVLEEYEWPGNLPELHNAVEFGAIKAYADGCEELGREHLPANLLRITETAGSGRWDYRYHLARTEVALTNRALEEKGAANKTQLAKILGYTDRFAFSRRIRKALEEFPDIARDFPKVRGMFRIAN